MMLVKDEADIIGPVVRHLLDEVDHVYVSDNGSTDGTAAILTDLYGEFASRLTLRHDPEVGYYQAAKTTALARLAHHHGFQWVIPCDADEVWYSPHGRLADVLMAQPREVLFARAPLVYHISTGEDGPADDPLVRLGWRFRDDQQPSNMTKVACRTSKDIEIDMGNHEATAFGKVRSNWNHTAHGLLVVRHYPWRSAAQFLSKITNGANAYAAAPDLDPTYGEHWKAFGLPSDPGFRARVTDWYQRWGYVRLPHSRPDLMYDPVAGALAARAHVVGVGA